MVQFTYGKMRNLSLSDGGRYVVATACSRERESISHVESEHVLCPCERTQHTDKCRGSEFFLPKQRRTHCSYSPFAKRRLWRVCSLRVCVRRLNERGCVQNNCLVDPASSICLFQRLSHACLSTVVFTRRYRGRLIKSVVVQMGPSSRYTWITVVIPELIHATHIPRCSQEHRRKHLLDQCPTAWCALCARTVAARINGDSG